MCAPATAQSDTFTASTLHNQRAPSRNLTPGDGPQETTNGDRRAAPCRDIDLLPGGDGGDPGAGLIRVPSGSDPVRVDGRRESLLRLAGAI
jgi:hypothetical protein